MTVRAVTYYQVVCDEDGCKAEPNDDYSAWSDADVAEQTALDADWGYEDLTGKHWCPKHRPKCDPGQHAREYPEERCTKCGQWPEDDEEMDRP